MSKKHFQLTRRKFFWGTVAVGTLATLFLSRITKKPQPYLSIHQGYTDKTSTIITVLRAEKQTVQYAILVNQSPSVDITFKIRTSTQYESSLDRLDINGLQVGKLYTLEVSENGKVVERREFAALDTDMTEPKISVISCSADEWRVDHEEMWSSLFSTKPDLIFSLGDNVYVDGSSWGWGVLWPVFPDPSRIWRRYTDMRKNLELYRQPKLIPMLAVWDDHDFGFNGADSQYVHKDYVKSVFEIFFPRPEKNKLFESGPGLTMAWNAFKTRFIFLDSRFYRVSNTDPLSRTQWGALQKQWMSSQLNTSEEPIWLLNGSQFVGGDPENSDNDSLAKQHPEDLEWLRQQVIKLRQKITLISGDVHFSEVVKMPLDWGSGVYEITSSAFHAISTEPRGPGDRLALATKNNFIILQILNSVPKTMSLKVTCYGKFSKPLFDLVVIPSKTEV